MAAEGRQASTRVSTRDARVRSPRAYEHFLYTAIGPLHGFEENVFELIALAVEPADLHILSSRDFVELPHFERIRQDQLHAALCSRRGFAAQLLYRLQKAAVVFAARLQFQEPAVGTALFLQVAERRHVPALENQDLVDRKSV